MNTLTFANGLRLIYQQTPDNPVSACHLFFHRGTTDEVKSEHGLTTLMWALMLKGTKQRTARKLAEDLESLGAHVGGGASHDHSHASCHAIADYFPQTLEIFAQTLLEPAHHSEEVAKEKTAHVAAIRSKKESIFSVAHDLLNMRVYGEHPYAVPSIGFEESAAALSTEQVRRRHKEVVVPNETVMSLASSVPLKKLLPALKSLFGPAAWPKAKSAPASLKAAAAKIAPQMATENSPFEQAYLMIGFPAVASTSPDYVPLKLVAAALGGGMSSRLFQSLREQRALAYDVGAFVSGRKKGSSFVVYMGLQRAKLEEARREILRELERIQKEKMPVAELETVKNFFKGSFILDHQTNSQRSYYIGWSVSAGRGLDYHQNFLRAIDRTTPAILQRAAKACLSRPGVTVEILPK